MPAKFKKNRKLEKNPNHGRNTKDGSFRIIGGEHRSRRLSFPSVDGLRPTTDRVRETLFNWLGHNILGARVLDLFAGSGALGFESLSRDADFVDFVEINSKAQRFLQDNLVLLKVAPKSARINEQDALSYLSSYQDEAFDIIFIDPPFRKDLAQQVIDAVSKPRICKENALIYLETELELTDLSIPNQWHEAKAKTAGQVSYRLFRVEEKLNSESK